jgi:hypothetical protein
MSPLISRKGAKSTQGFGQFLEDIDIPTTTTTTTTTASGTTTTTTTGTTNTGTTGTTAETLRRCTSLQISIACCTSTSSCGTLGAGTTCSPASGSFDPDFC